MSRSFTGHPLFDTAKYLEDLADFHLHPSIPRFLESLPQPTETIREDYEISRQFLLRYADVSGTFTRFRSEVQRFLNYLWVTAKRTLARTDSDVVSAYFRTLKNPPKSWINRGVFAAFTNSGALRTANPDWRPFALRATDDKAVYSASQASLNASRTALQTFFKFLVSQQYLLSNPLDEVRKRDRKAKPQLAKDVEADVRRLTDWQWAFLLESLTEAAAQDPRYERHLFVVVIMKSLFLRVGELAPRPLEDGAERIPVFGDFRRRVIQGEEYWSYFVFGKGDKARSVTLPDACLPYLRRWRAHLGLPGAMPEQGERNPILPSSRGRGLGKRQIQRVYEQAIMVAVTRMRDQGYLDEASQLEAIKSETHYLRHTGASQAIESGADIRHISEELGHASAAFTESVYVNSDQARRRFEGRERQI
ncbi:tyrosine-type recombinase/integrase [Marinobacter sp. X15-166B]|uniref:tyrosine-type recombinase/integrase n=1 Tax=Marinobacter sp. X15-166B TaxID=1897620 RepID=UPI00085CAFE8|nr:tyrosine-type recombinase/integrase [Marinobacter sp. X15-166B]OEY67561.1 integrase [Marinobacter sp. X15-166B]